MQSSQEIRGNKRRIRENQEKPKDFRENLKEIAANRRLDTKSKRSRWQHPVWAPAEKVLILMGRYGDNFFSCLMCALMQNTFLLLLASLIVSSLS